MDNNRISITQLRAVVFLEILGMDAIILPKIGGNVYAVAIMAVCTLLLALFSVYTFKNFSYYKLNTILGRIIQFLFSLKISAVLGFVLYIFTDVINMTILEDANLKAVCIVLILTGAFCGFSGIEPIGRMAEIVFPFVFFPILIALIVGIRDIDVSNYNTVFERAYIWRGVMLSFNVSAIETVILGKDFLNTEKFKKIFLPTIIIGLIFILALTTASLGVYGAIDYNLQIFPTLEYIYTSGLFEFLQRQEEIFICLWLFAVITFIGVHFYFSESLLKKSTGMGRSICTVIVAIIIFALYLLPKNINQAMTQFCYTNVYGGILFIVTIPLFFGRYIK